MTGVLGGLGINGKLIVLGAATDAVPVVPAQLIGGRQSIMAGPAGHLSIRRIHSPSAFSRECGR